MMRISRAVKVTALFAGLTMMLAGCKQSDALRPDLNSLGGLRTIPDSQLSAENILDVDGKPPEGSGDIGDLGGGSDSLPPDSSVAEVSKFAGLTNPTVDAESYKVYLDLNVYSPVNKLLSELPAGKQEKIYFRVFHHGYTFNPNTGIMRQALIYDTQHTGGIKSVDTTVLPEFMFSWLGKSDLNKNKLPGEAARALNLINGSGVSNTTDWLGAAGAVGAGMFDRNLYAMWGNESIPMPELSDFVVNIRRSPSTVLPNLRLDYWKNANQKGYILLNSTADLATARYENIMPVKQVDSCFIRYNQSPTRSASRVSTNSSTDTSMLFAYMDGYTQTMVFLAVAPGNTLKSVLGPTVYNSVSSCINNAYSPAEWVQVTSVYPSSRVIQAGTKGVD